MKLSVIIVNYNVKFFIEQCLYSVFCSLNNIEGEVIVVDNNSVDGSQAMIRDKFPEVKLISNTDNVGFSKATNQGIRASMGEYVLCLNPDTVVEESTFRQCIDFMDTHPDAGGIGPKMIDGKGNYLPESKRGIPTPQTAFYKISGLIKLFPHSARYARYYMGHLSINQTNPIEVLTGSFMFMRKSVLEKTGLFDEVFFMYGEDIDLSYRILKAGYSNYYFPETTIIHYRGESTKKGSINYVLVFYKAMKIFTQKHFVNSRGLIFTFLINLAINLRAFLSILKRGIVKALPIVLDLVTFYAVIYFVIEVWEKYYIKGNNFYPDTYKYMLIPAYVVLWIVCLGFSKSYWGHTKLKNVFKGALLGTFVNLVVYALVPADFHYSRAIILIGATLVFFMAIINRYLLKFNWYKGIFFGVEEK